VQVSTMIRPGGGMRKGDGLHAPWSVGLSGRLGVVVFSLLQRTLAHPLGRCALACSARERARGGGGGALRAYGDGAVGGYGDDMAALRRHWQEEGGCRRSATWFRAVQNLLGVRPQACVWGQ
jgi:hypothetical protein